ncbi:LPXTG cell wall anchor domain-containing protein, partial [[Clostridium] scindens]|uniref:LPXTG cell wall anchor domain-containing protein n=1 Tax=Clostridium scindens (strain JCM 10418 / VPI 12708) TaxID=29347 RepID=UPI001A9BB413
KTRLNVKVVDEKGSPVSGLGLCFKSTNYGEHADIDFDAVTDGEGNVSYECSDNEFDDDVYELVLKDTSKYTCDEAKKVIFGMENWKTFISTIDDEEYTGEEIVLTVKSAGGSEPEKPEVDKTRLNVKVVDEKGSPVSGLGLCFKSTNYGEYADIDFDAVTDGEGNVSYECSDNEFDDDVYELVLKDTSKYTCDEAKKVIFGVENWKTFISTIDDEEYTGEEIVLTVKSVGGSEPEEPEPEPEINTVISSITQSTEKGSTATITVQGKDLPETMYYIVNYKKMGQYAEEEYSAGTYKEIKTTGNETERTFEVKLPALSEYPGALSWRVGVNTLKDDGYYFTENIVIKKDSSVDDNKDSENPDKPNKPGNPSTIGASGKPGNGHNSSDKAGSRSVKTGDTANVLPFVGGMTVAAFVILVLLKKKRTVK